MELTMLVETEFLDVGLGVLPACVDLEICLLMVERLLGMASAPVPVAGLARLKIVLVEVGLMTPVSFCAISAELKR